MPTFPLARLVAFRTALHACCTRRADALFELGDALLCAQAFPSLPHLSLEPVCRRGWGSVYAALAHGEVDAERLRDLLVSSLPADPPVFAVDVTTWPRCDAGVRLRGATTTIPPATRPASRSSPAGPTSGSRRSASIGTPGPPRSTRRGCFMDDTDQQAAVQVRALLGRLPAGGPVPCSCSTPASRLRPAHLGPG